MQKKIHASPVVYSLPFYCFYTIREVENFNDFSWPRYCLKKSGKNHLLVTKIPNDFFNENCVQEKNIRKNTIFVRVLYIGF